jgi:hypothetical protein
MGWDSKWGAAWADGDPAWQVRGIYDLISLHGVRGEPEGFMNSGSPSSTGNCAVIAGCGPDRKRWSGSDVPLRMCPLGPKQQGGRA